MSGLEAPTIALVGAGAMGGALVRGWLQAVRKGGGLTLTVVEPNFDPELERELEAAGAVLNPVARGAVDVLVLAVKPQTFPSVIEAARALVGEQTLVMSVMAGVTLDKLCREFNAQRVVRCVPNTPARIGRGITAYVMTQACTPADRELTEQLLEPLGSVEPIAAERLMDVVTAVSGSGPAYVFLLAEVLAAAAEQEGLDREAAIRLANRTVAGAGALMLETGDSASTLRKQVTSPGGTTEAALDVLGAGNGLGPLLRRAVAAAAQRSRDLGKA
ncbi:pyrroline-5-carboxylate reductase [Terricaulis sp.]|uniref:pyrroline-5-carboxylate reductase n=1 Tax=Terricaulis sp. TaxID=2768686 RepID=UPI002AC716F0|nr:pyrroline-5-carboxylate reductase [Terricaulis sp.]MDZ4689776.1 pyrroline-5-carboxylate reductase [Terricaulis sp.]